MFERLSWLIQIKTQLSTNRQLLEAAQHLLPASTSTDQHKALKSNVLQSLGTLQRSIPLQLAVSDQTVRIVGLITDIEIILSTK
jgi:hypothetical protein